MHRILVEEKHWISESRFCMPYVCLLLPGSEALQLAAYIGSLAHLTRGGDLAAGLFIRPVVITLTTLSIIYAVCGHVGLVAAAFFGLKAAVLATLIEVVIGIWARRRGSRLRPFQFVEKPRPSARGRCDSTLSTKNAGERSSTAFPLSTQ